MAELGGCSRVEQVACLLECGKRIGIQHGGPGITVVTSLVARGEDMVVERRTVANDDLVDHSHLLQALSLKGVHIQTFGCSQFVEIHIQDRCREQLCRYKALVELAGSIDLLNQFVRYNLACLVVESIGLQNFRLVGIVLHEL